MTYSKRMANTDKFCVYWQGRRSMAPGVVRKHGVFSRCSKSLDQAVQSMREVSKRRGSSALTQENRGLSLTLMTCRKGKCRATHFGRKLGLKR